MPGSQFYTSTVWRAFRAEILRVRPVCEVPGCTKRSHHADHKTSIRDGGAPLDGRNIMALCAHHHSSKTAQVDGGFGNRRGGAVRFVVRGCDAQGNPIDPQHNWLRKALSAACVAPLRAAIVAGSLACARSVAAPAGMPRHRGESEVRAAEGAQTAPVLDSRPAKTAIKRQNV